MRLFSEFEVDLLIDDITTAAVDAIEQAAAEAAKAAVAGEVVALAKDAGASERVQRVVSSAGEVVKRGGSAA